MAHSTPQHFTPQIDSDYGEQLTQEVANFVLSTKVESIPTEVISLAKKSILDGFGLALAGSVAASGNIVQKYLEKIGTKGKAIVIGTNMKTAARFAAFANGVGVHADDYDDTQLAIYMMDKSSDPDN